MNMFRHPSSLIVLIDITIMESVSRLTPLFKNSVLLYNVKTHPFV